MKISVRRYSHLLYDAYTVCTALNFKQCLFIITNDKYSYVGMFSFKYDLSLIYKPEIA